MRWKNPWVKVNVGLVLFFVMGFLGTYLTDLMHFQGVFGEFDSAWRDHPRYYWWFAARVTLGIWYGVGWVRMVYKTGNETHVW